MLKWDAVRRLIVLHLAPAVESMGFSPPGRTMRRNRGPFVDVIDFRCGKYADRFRMAFGCGVRGFVRQNPKPWDCAFELQSSERWPDDCFRFRQGAVDQIATLETLRPLFLAEVHRWFGLLHDVPAARQAADANCWSSPSTVGHFGVSSPKHTEVVRQLDAVVAESSGRDSLSS